MLQVSLLLAQGSVPEGVVAMPPLELPFAIPLFIIPLLYNTAGAEPTERTSSGLCYRQDRTAREFPVEIQ